MDPLIYYYYPKLRRIFFTQQEFYSDSSILFTSGWRWLKLLCRSWNLYFDVHLVPLMVLVSPSDEYCSQRLLRDVLSSLDRMEGYFRSGGFHWFQSLAELKTNSDSFSLTKSTTVIPLLMGLTVIVCPSFIFYYFYPLVKLDHPKATHESTSEVWLAYDLIRAESHPIYRVTDVRTFSLDARIYIGGDEAYFAGMDSGFPRSTSKTPLLHRHFLDCLFIIIPTVVIFRF